MKDITLYVGFTSVTVKINKFSKDIFFILRKFTFRLNDYEFDRKLRKFVKDKSYFIGASTKGNQEQDILVIPKNYLPELMVFLTDHSLTYDKDIVAPIKTREVNRSIVLPWKPREDQVPAIDYLINQEGNIKCLALSCGIGKSFCSVYSSIQLNKPFIIITSGLVKQWRENVISQTDIPEADIYDIRGAESIRNIMENNLKPIAIIASLETIRNFAQNKKEYHDFEYSLQEVMKHLQIGTKIIDECHENFHAIVSIDLVVNIEVNIYLSATYIRNNQSTHKIFDVIFPPNNRFGEGNYDKYVNIIMYEYSSFVPSRYVNIGGTYSHFNYEKYLLKHERGVYWFTNSLLKKIINDHYISKKKDGQKLLILMATLDNINKVVNQLRKIYPSLSILPFTAKDKEENLEADIIVSTIGSSGTGRDIPNLLTTILTVSIKAEGAVKQIVGRLRKLKDGSEVYFCDMFNEQSESHVRHKMVRSNLYLRLGKTYKEGKI